MTHPRLTARIIERHIVDLCELAGCTLSRINGAVYITEYPSDLNLTMFSEDLARRLIVKER